MKNELEKLYNTKKYYVDNNVSQSSLSFVVNSIKEKRCKSTECPDIEGDNFGIEHTEVSPFYQKKKGNTYKRFKQTIKESLRVVDLPYFNYNYLDLQLFTKLLGVEERSEFVENIVFAINEKNKKFSNYKKFVNNGLWLEFPTYVTFFDDEFIGYFLQEDIYKALYNSVFDFFLIGNNNCTIMFSKEEYSYLYNNQSSCNRFIINFEYLDDDFPIFKITSKKDIKLKLNGDKNIKYYNISEDMNILHLSYFYAISEKFETTEQKVKLLCDDFELSVVSWKIEEEFFIIDFLSEYVDGQIKTNFKQHTNFDLIFKDIETLNIKPFRCKYDEKSIYQKIVSSTKRFILYNEYGIKVFSTPPNYNSMITSFD